MKPRGTRPEKTSVAHQILEELRREEDSKREERQEGNNRPS